MPEHQQGSAHPPTPAMYNVAVEDRPIRIRSNETFWFEIDVSRVLYFSVPGFYRLNMMGIWYRSLGEELTQRSYDGSVSDGPLPRAVLRVLRHPLYSTLQLPANEGGFASSPRKYRLFQRPLGQSDEITLETLTELETNMVQACQLGTPEEFDLWGFRAEMSLNQPVVERIQFLEACTWRWYFGDRAWYSGPLTHIPCASTIIAPPVPELHRPRPAAGQERREAGVRRIRS